MARKTKSEYDKLHAEIAELRKINTDLTIQLLKLQTLNVKISNRTTERLIWLTENQDKLSWILRLGFNDEYSVIEPHFVFFDKSDEMVYNVRFPKGILEEVLAK